MRLRTAGVSRTNPLRLAFKSVKALDIARVAEGSPDSLQHSEKAPRLAPSMATYHPQLQPVKFEPPHFCSPLQSDRDRVSVSLADNITAPVTRQN